MTTYRMTTNSNSEIKDSVFVSLTGFKVTDTIPSGTSIRYLLKFGSGAWSAFKNGAWKPASNQALTDNIVLSEGNTSAELNALKPENLAGFGYQAINLAIAFQTAFQNNTQTIPTLTSIVISGISGDGVEKEVDLATIPTTNEDGEATQITDIAIEQPKDSGPVDVMASIQKEDGTWSDYMDYKSCFHMRAKAIRLRGRYHLRPHDKIVKLNKISVKHDATEPSSFGNKGTCVTRYYTMPRYVREVHLVLKHTQVKDTKYHAYVSFKTPGQYREQWLPMTQDIVTPDRHQRGLVNEQFDYAFGYGRWGIHYGRTLAVRVEVEQMKGAEKDVRLGAGTGTPIAYRLPHHAIQDTIKVSPAGATWSYDSVSDTLSVTAPAGAEVSISYSWASRTTYLKSMHCLFNE